MSDNNSSNRNSCIVPIVVACITTIGVIVAALIGRPPQPTPQAPTPTPTPSSNSNSSASPDTDFFTIVGSYPNQEEARVRANEIQKNNPNLNIQVFVPYQNNPFYSVMAASRTSKAKALEICRIARKEGIAQDAFVWSFSNPHIPCN